MNRPVCTVNRLSARFAEIESSTRRPVARIVLIANDRFSFKEGQRAPETQMTETGRFC
jgi:hypothetical protein